MSLLLLTGNPKLTGYPKYIGNEIALKFPYKKTPRQGRSIQSGRARSLPPGSIDCDKDKDHTDSCDIETIGGFKANAIQID